MECTWLDCVRFTQKGTSSRDHGYIIRAESRHAVLPNVVYLSTHRVFYYYSSVIFSRKNGKAATRSAAKQGGSIFHWAGSIWGPVLYAELSQKNQRGTKFTLHPPRGQVQRCGQKVTWPRSESARRLHSPPPSLTCPTLNRMVQGKLRDLPASIKDDKKGDTDRSASGCKGLQSLNWDASWMARTANAN